MIPSLGYQLRALARALGVGLHVFLAKRKATRSCKRDGHQLAHLATKPEGPAYLYCQVFGCHFWSWADES